MKRLLVLLMVISSLLLASCDTKPKKPPVELHSPKKEIVIKIPFKERGGVKIIPVKLNGVSMDMIYDTGCSGVHLSSLELKQLAKQGCFSNDDFVGKSLASIADGSIVENDVVRLRSIEISPELILHNIRATVSQNQNAPILLGDEVLDNIARKVEVDNMTKTINFTK